MATPELVHKDIVPEAKPGWIFSHYASGPLLEWEWAHKRLREATTFWIATNALEGRPHVRPVWGFWQDGGFWFSTTNRSVPYIEADQEVVLHTESGEEVVIVEGRCDRLYGKENLQRISDGYLERYNHSTNATDEGVFTLEGYGGPGFKITPTKVLGWIAPQFDTATRWDFPA
ncbi:pyridoxamine 5'-phosphate oxidase [Streptomyces sp. 3MP-14]|uniref:Pyridoxamine 5'-phosphate oxidase n=1 Tax=Streptomyces mimosae TaxID=2586635 RepID=A0A5N6AI84_9ACTN|nr:MULTISPECIES: pyridoxamine 5'-phosphate oxidase family protein [Streptomyces]KAB8167945.1 pyridoxamine 5'-phosphate oxidase [Streptomyces mimosae]KAB8177407.1 pyridoxamine 5'-phosphate oxidase [Streptomyces sp. 3MP-14]